MKQAQFYRKSDESLVLVDANFPEHGVTLALDTGASHTTIDLAAVIIAGYRIEDAVDTAELETASGIIEAYIFNVHNFTAIGITKSEMRICSYDFFSFHVMKEFDGVLGLDFFEEKKVCIDLKNSLITVHEA